MPSDQQLSTTPPAARDSWRTPGFVFQYFDRMFHFDIDLAADPGNTLCGKYYAADDDALAQNWRAVGVHRGWCNPPYSKIAPWLHKAVIEADRGFTSVFLIPTSNGEAYYGSHVYGVASEVVFISGRLAFLTPDGVPVAGNRFGSMVAIYRGYDLRNTRYQSITRQYMQQQTGDPKCNVKFS